MASPLLNINPSQLEFLFEAETELKSTLNLRNVNEDVRVAFKIKTTNSERFVVCPPSGIIEPGTTRIVKVYLKAQRSYDDDLRLCKDRFLVQSISVGEEALERDVSSNLFKSLQRQEAKLKVVVAAPLAHSSVLENEIRGIAMRQGVEGHRAVVRKFSELLLAKGIISQAQVVLAFSTVGEIFQGMQSTNKATTAERERTLKQFLGGRRSLPVDLSIAMPLSNSGTSLLTVPSLTLPTPPPSEAQNAAMEKPAASQEVPLKAAAITQAEASPAVGPTTPERDDMTASESTSPSASQGGTSSSAAGENVQTAKGFNNEASEVLFDANGDRESTGAEEEEKVEVTPKPQPVRPKNTQSLPAAAKRHLNFDHAFAPPNDKANIKVDTTGKMNQGGLQSAKSRKRNPTIGELVFPGDVIGAAGEGANGVASSKENGPPWEQIQDIKGANCATPAPVENQKKEEIKAEEGSSLAKEEPTPDCSSSDEQQLHSVTTETIQEEEAPRQTSIDRPQSARSPWQSGTPDTLGRTGPKFEIDRLATPAIKRKASMPGSAMRMENNLGNGSHTQRSDDSQNFRTSLRSVVSSIETGQAGSWKSGEVFDNTPAHSARDESLERQDSGKSNDPGSWLVQIPSGNTLKMANLFNSGK